MGHARLSTTASTTRVRTRGDGFRAAVLEFCRRSRRLTCGAPRNRLDENVTPLDRIIGRRIHESGCAADDTADIWAQQSGSLTNSSEVREWTKATQRGPPLPESVRELTVVPLDALSRELEVSKRRGTSA